VGRILRRILPGPAVKKLRRMTRSVPVGGVDLGDLRRLAPISKEWGFDRGQPIDRYYIERFLESWSGDVRGHTLEVGSNRYTTRFGGDRVVKSDVLHVSKSEPPVTIVADLTRDDGIPGATFDCVILTQTLQFIFDTRSALENLHRILVPGGVLLATFPGICQISREDMDQFGQPWSFTTYSARRLFEEAFSGAELGIRAYGNVLSAVALLEGLAAQDLEPEELKHHDPDYEVLVTVRARKAVS
jgi:hypothetical protein